jgi:uncharacterized protein DUF3667
MLCPNCGNQALQYCPSCGQKQRERPTVAGLAGELFQELVNVDGKVLTTVRSVLTRPGQLTIDFLEGRRARHLSPLRLFLIVFAFFFFLSGELLTTASGTQELYGPLIRTRAAAKGLAVEEYVTRLEPTILIGIKTMRAGLLVVNSVWYFLLFRRRRPHYIDHLVLSLELASISLTIGILGSLLIRATGSPINNLLIAAPASVGYATLAAHRFYGRSWPSTLWRVLFAYLLGLILGAVVVLGWTGLVLAFN